MAIPESLKEEHAHLMELMGRAVREEGAVGEAAQAVEVVLHPHFLKEEELALPPLGMLTVSGDEPKGDIDDIIALTDRFGKELPRMLEEHVLIAERSEVLALEAQNAGKDEYADFARELMHHARLEEEIMYPASLLVGSYLRLWKARNKR